ncbi:MAG: CBS domain-containing protein [Methanolobus sp.]|uniref:CBS domain-containing protein n=1 Tax=Methanolobus sp. TaxID=1874737 RepID=UPI00273131A1|nr:CBS domain-containing protein [Methanolobus sp.]MDP2216526.1 CBS domain-containing protein [Methanolobus sp.]
MNAQRDLETDVSIKEIQNEMSVKELMTRDIFVMDADTTVLEVAREMTDRNADSVIVVDDGDIVGIITEKDVVSKTVAKNRLPGEMNARSIMSSPIISIKPSTGMIEAAELMVKSDIRRLAVMDGNIILGMITYRDIMAISPGLNTILQNLIELHREGDFLRETDVERGICQRCGATADNLREVNGLNLCEDCSEEEGYYD